MESSFAKDQAQRPFPVSSLLCLWIVMNCCLRFLAASLLQMGWALKCSWWPTSSFGFYALYGYPTCNSWCILSWAWDNCQAHLLGVNIIVIIYILINIPYLFIYYSLYFSIDTSVLCIYHVNLISSVSDFVNPIFFSFICFSLPFGNQLFPKQGFRLLQIYFPFCW